MCRIDNHPSTAEQGCASTPPANAYWAYYHARWTDSGWTYNAVGATSTHPAPGSIEAWAFGARVLPGVSPAAAVATVTTTPPPTTGAVAATADRHRAARDVGRRARGRHDGTVRQRRHRRRDLGPRKFARRDHDAPRGSTAAIVKAARVKARRAAAAAAVAAKRGGGSTPTTTTANAGAGVVDRADAPALAARGFRLAAPHDCSPCSCSRRREPSARSSCATAGGSLHEREAVAARRASGRLVDLGARVGDGGQPHHEPAARSRSSSASRASSSPRAAPMRRGRARSVRISCSASSSS